MAFTASPITAALVPLMPLGRSTASTGAPLALIAVIIARASPSTGRLEARAEQCVDDQRRPADRLRIERQHRMLPAARRGGRVALELIALAPQDHRDLAPLCGEFGGCDKTVAAIVAGAGHDQDRPLLHQRIGGIGDRLPRAQHQLEAGRASRNAELVGPLHFSVGRTSIPLPWCKRLFERHRSMPTHLAEKRYLHTIEPFAYFVVFGILCRSAPPNRDAR